MRSEGVCKNSEVTQAVLTLCLHQSSVSHPSPQGWRACPHPRRTGLRGTL